MKSSDVIPTKVGIQMIKGWISDFSGMTFFILLSLFINIAHAESHIIKSHGYAVFGELKYPKDFTHFEYANPNAPKGGEIRHYYPAGFDALNDYILKGNKAPELWMTHETLLTPAGDEPYSSYGMLAESIEYPVSKEWIVFNIRPEAKWHDGKSVTAEDVVFSFNIFREKGDPNYKIIFQDVEKAEALSSHRIKFYIKNPRNPLIFPLVGESLYIMPKHFLKDKEFDKFDNEPILGSGPYKIKEFKFNKYIIYERIKDHWAKNVPANNGMYNFDEIRYDSYLDSVVAVEAFKSGAYDFKEENISRVWATGYDIKPVRKGDIIKELVQHSIPANLQTTFINMRRNDGKDINFREAMTLAFDFDWMNKALFYSLYKRTESYFDNTHFKAQGLPQGEELKILQKYRGKIPDHIFTQEFVMPSTGADPMRNRNNLRKAKDLLFASGYKLQNGKMISPYTNKPVELEMLYVSSVHEKMLGAFRNNLKKIGITLKLRMIDSAQFMDRIKSFDFDMTPVAFNALSVPGSNQKQLWHSSADVKGGLNFAGLHSDVVDDLISGLINASHEEELIANAKALDRVLLWGYYSVPQMYSSNYRLLYWNKFGIPAVRPKYSMGKESWWAKSAE
jgi:microcin C transport system substrate-binding protein